MIARDLWKNLIGKLGFRGFSGTIWTITTEYLLTQLGYFILLPILPFLLHRAHGLPMTEVGTVMLFFTLMIRGSSVLIGNLADRFPLKGAILTALLVTAVCFALLSLVHGIWLTYLLLAVTGFAISLNFTVSKALVASKVKERSEHVRAFGLINLFVNVSAAFGPIIGTFFLEREQYAIELLFLAGCYVVAFLLILFLLERVPVEAGRGRARISRAEERLVRVHRSALQGPRLVSCHFSTSPAGSCTVSSSRVFRCSRWIASISVHSSAPCSRSTPS